MAKRPTPVARCTNCGAPWYNATLINQECGSGKMAAGRYVRKADVAVGYGLVESPWYETKAELSRLASKVTRGGLTGMECCKRTVRRNSLHKFALALIFAWA